MASISQATMKANLAKPITFLTIGNMQVPAPLLRITTCGLLTIEIVESITSTEPPLARYRSLTPEQLRGRGTIPALTLLKFLLSRSERFASRDWLMDQFCRDRGEAFSSVRLDNIASQLRSLLCPATYESLRTHVVTLLRTGSGSGDGYQLAPYPLIWIDHEALAKHIEQAARIERFGDDALADWERAYELAKRGPYCPDEMYSDWAAGRRGEIAGMLRQSVQALARLYVAQHGRAGEEEALLLLRSYWQKHPREEDVLRPLMELLGRRESFQQALEYYEHLTALLTEEERAPDPRTADIAEYVRTKQIQRSSQATVSSLPQVYTPKQQDLFVQGESTDASIDMKQDLSGLKTVGELEKENNQNMDPLCRATVTGPIGLVDGVAAQSEWWERIVSPHTSAMNVEVFTHTQQLLESGWGLSNAGELPLAEQVLLSFLPRMIQLAPYQREAASLAAEGLRLRGILAAHQQCIADKLTLCLQAVECARQANDPNILVAELTELAVAFEYVQQPKNALKTYQEALSLANQASPLIRSRIYGRSAVAFARKGQVEDALFYIRVANENFPQYPEREANFRTSDHGFHKLARHNGLVYFALGNFQKALEAFESILTSSYIVAPERSRLEILNDLGRTAILLNRLDRYVYCLEEGISGGMRLKSKRRFDEVLQTFRQDMPKAWLNDSQIQQIVERFPPLMLEKQSK